MPIFEYLCEPCGRVEESYLQHWDLPTPPCPACGSARVRLASRFACPFSGSIHKYTDPRRENAHIDGYWAYRRATSTSGQPEPVYLDSMQAVREFNKAEGLAAPGEVPTNSTISADGKKILSDGMPGQWRSYTPSVVPSFEGRKTIGKDPAPREIGLPCTATVADAKAMESIAAEAAKI